MGVTGIFCSFRLVLEGKTGREKPESSRLKFLWKFSSNNFTLPDAEYNTCEPLNRGGIADSPLLERYSQCAKSPECQVSGKRWTLLFYLHVHVSQPQEPFCNDFLPVWTFYKIQRIYPFSANEKSNFYELWQQQKQLKTMEMSEAWPDTFGEGYIHQFQHELTYKIHLQQQKLWI